MIRFERVPEPLSFDDDVRKPGSRWLDEHPNAKQFYPYWSKHLSDLRDGFQSLCGYSAMHIEDGTVDHYRSSKNRPDLAYEWNNYRFASERMNKVKGTEDEQILDPFEVEDSWFELLLPSFMLVTTPRVPEEHRRRAEHTLKRLGLRDGEPIIRRRKEWYDQFRAGYLNLAGLRAWAPLLARAIERRLMQINPNAFDGEQTAFQRFMGGELTLPGLRREAPLITQAIDEALPPADRRAR
ncbi:MAG: hypothetical protein L6Q76_34970 [Polyangiaceae bacterium]|nr:hypothetical protein [Polyangiaceae bacterium]